MVETVVPNRTLGPDGKRRGLRAAAKVGQLAIAVVLLALIVRSVKWGEFVGAIEGARPVWLLPLLLVNLGDRVWMAAKWRFLLRGLGVQVRFAAALGHYFLGGLVGQALQWQLGGDVARVVGLGRSVGQSGRIAGSVVAERLVGFGAVAALASVSVVVLADRFDTDPWTMPLFAFVFGSCVASFGILLLLLGPGRAMGLKLAVALGRWLPGGADRLGELASPGLRRVIGIFFLLTLGEQFVPLLGMHFLQRVFDLGLSPLQIFCVLPVVMLISRLPVTPEALGLREGAFVFLLGLLGISPGRALTLALTTRVVDLAGNALGAGGLWWAERWKTR